MQLNPYRDLPWEQLMPTARRKLLCSDKDYMFVLMECKAGTAQPPHSHPHTQVTYIVKGSFAFTVDGETKVVNQGDTVLMPSGSLHGCECLEEGILCDVFTPMREDFIK